MPAGVEPVMDSFSASRVENNPLERRRVPDSKREGNETPLRNCSPVPFSSQCWNLWEMEPCL